MPTVVWADTQVRPYVSFTIGSTPIAISFNTDFTPHHSPPPRLTPTSPLVRGARCAGLVRGANGIGAGPIIVRHREKPTRARHAVPLRIIQCRLNADRGLGGHIGSPLRIIHHRFHANRHHSSTFPHQPSCHLTPIKCRPWFHCIALTPHPPLSGGQDVRALSGGQTVSRVLNDTQGVVVDDGGSAREGGAQDHPAC